MTNARLTGEPVFLEPATAAVVARWRAASHSLRGACASLGAVVLQRELLAFEQALDKPVNLEVLQAMARRVVTRLATLNRELAEALNAS